MRVIGIDGFEVFVRMGREEYTWLVKKLAIMDNDDSEEN